MAVTMSLVKPDQLIEMAGVDSASVELAKAKGIEIAINLEDITVSKGFEKLKIPMKVSSLMDIVNGKASTAVKLIVKQGIENAIKALTEGHTTISEDIASQVATVHGTITAAQVIAGGITVAQPTTDDPVPLHKAVSMYQKTKGTSPDAVYRVVALSEPKGFLNVSARYSTNTLSIRIEGTALSVKAASLSTHGFMVHPQYASLHLEAKEPLVAARALGAVITGLGLAFTTPVPQFAKLA